MDIGSYGNAATELVGEKALADSQARGALMQIVKNSVPRRFVSSKSFWLGLAPLLAGVGMGVELLAFRTSYHTDSLLCACAGIGAVSGSAALWVALRTQRTLAAVILLMQSREAES